MKKALVILIAMLPSICLAGIVWGPIPDIPHGRSYAGSGVIDGKIYVVGGWAGSMVNHNEAYDPAASPPSWTSLAPLPVGRFGMATAAVDPTGGGNEKLYCIGGWDPCCHKRVDIYDPVSDTWSQGTDMPTCRGCMGGAAVGTVIYVVGGRGPGCSNASLATVEAYDTVNNTWSTVAPLMQARANHQCVELNGKVYAIGGGNENAALPMETVEMYDPATNTWTMKASLCTARYRFQVAVFDGRIYVAGGFVAGGVETASVEVYDPVADKWTYDTSLPEARVEAASGALEGYFYNITGHTPTQLMDPSGVRGQVVEPPDFSLGCDHPPVAEAGPNQTLECSSQAGASVTLDGSASTDADSTPGTNDDIVLFEWYEDYGLPSQRPLGSGEVITVALSVGIHNITLVVTDSAGATNDDTMVLEVQDTTAPVIQCPANVTLEANGACQATYGGPPATATDSCDDSPVVTSVPPLPATFSGLGDHAIPWTATDESGNTATCTQTVTIIDTTLPVIACPADVTTECRGPSGAPVTLVASAADNCDPNPVITNSFAAGGPDASSVYPIGITQVIFTARDASGNTSSCTAKVTVIDTQCPAITNIRELRESLEHHCFFSEPSVPAEAWDLCDPSPDIQIHFQSVPDTPCDRAVTIEARDDFGNLCPETILFYQDPNDCDRDGIPDCVRCDAAFGFACFSVNRLEIRRKLAERNRADDSMDSKGSFHLFLCPAGTDAGDSRLDIEKMISPDDIVRITLGAQVTQNTPAVGGGVVFEIRFGDFEKKKPGLYTYKSPREIEPKSKVDLDFDHCVFDVHIQNIDLSDLALPDTSFILEIGRHRGFEILTLEPDRKGEKFELKKKPEISCCDEDEDADESSDS